MLTLSATPIPRTLHLALVNGRDMSVIESPPEERLPVETYVAEYNPGMIKEALEREMRRGGRIYYVHNRVLGLENIAADLRSLVPGINIRIAHGQMSEDMLEDAMIAFYEGSCDVLLSTRSSKMVWMCPWPILLLSTEPKILAYRSCIRCAAG